MFSRVMTYKNFILSDVDNRSPYGTPKSHPATKQEAQLQKVEQSAGLALL